MNSFDVFVIKGFTIWKFKNPKNEWSNYPSLVACPIYKDKGLKHLSHQRWDIYSFLSDWIFNRLSGHSSPVYRDTVHMFMGHLTCLSGHSLQFMGHSSHVYRDTVHMFIRTQFTCLSGHGSHVHGTPHMFIGTQFTCVWDTSHVYPASRLKMVLMFKALFHGNRYADAEIPKYVSYQAEISLRLQPLEIRGGEARQ